MKTSFRFAALLILAASSSAHAERSAHLAESCQSLTWDTPVSTERYEGDSPDGEIEGPKLLKKLDAEVAGPKKKSPSEAAIRWTITENPWIWSKIPHVAARLPGIYLSLSAWFLGSAPIFQPAMFTGYPAIATLNEYPLLSSYAELDAAFAEFFGDPKLYDAVRANEGGRFFSPDSLATPAKIRQELADPAGMTSKEVDLSSLKPWQFDALCGLLTPFDFKGCSDSALSQVKNLASGDASSLAGPYLEKILTTTDARVSKAAYLVAQKVLKKFQAGNPEGDEFSDALASFRAVGFPEKEAREWAWDFTLLVFVHGQNTGLAMRMSGFVTPSNFWTIFSADFVSAVSVYFDLLKSKKGRPEFYSFPQAIASSCDNGKPYHFWVAAYSARKTRQEGAGVESASWGAYVLEMGYQMFSRTYGRDPDRDLREGTYSAWNARNRLDLSFAAAGAVYGARDARGERPKKTYSVDSAYAAQYRMAGRLVRADHALLSHADDPKWDWLKVEQWIGMMAPGWAVRVFE